MIIGKAHIDSVIRSGDQLAEFELSPLSPMHGVRYTLLFGEVQKTSSSLALEVSVQGEQRVRAFGGTIYMYGEGDLLGPDPHGRFVPIELSVDVTEAIRSLHEPRAISFWLKIVDHKGNELLEQGLVCKTIELDVTADE